MNSKHYTIQDIAREAQVGVGTVSRVLNNNPNVKDSTRKHVKQVIKRFDYQPSFTARSLRTQKSNTIGFIADAVTTTPFAVNIVKGAQDAALEHGKLLLIMDADNKAELREIAIKSMVEREVEGIIYAAMYHQEVQLSEAFEAVPTVLVDCYTQNLKYASSVPNEKQAGKDATNALIRNNHRRIAIILGSEIDCIYPAMRLRYKGYCEALKEAKLVVNPELIKVGDGNSQSSFELTLELMKINEPPTAIFCCTDRMALGTYDALRTLGLRVPDDVSIIGFDNQEIIAEQLYPPLSTMALPHASMGRWAVETLMTKQNPDPKHYKIFCPLVERESIRDLQK